MYPLAFKFTIEAVDSVEAVDFPEVDGVGTGHEVEDLQSGVGKHTGAELFDVQEVEGGSSLKLLPPIHIREIEVSFKGILQEGGNVQPILSVDPFLTVDVNEKYKATFGRQRC